MASISLQTLAATSPEIKQLLEKQATGELSAIEKIQLNELEIAVTQISQKLSADISLLVSDIAELKIQIDAEPDESDQKVLLQQTLAIKEQSLLDLQAEILSPTPSSVSLVRLQQETISANLKKTEMLVGMTVNSPSDLADFILQTTALNPYGRVRACDIEFLDMLVSIGKTTEKQQKAVQQLKERLRLN